jgi:hypothetical protein
MVSAFTFYRVVYKVVRKWNKYIWGVTLFVLLLALIMILLSENSKNKLLVVLLLLMMTVEAS